MSTTHTVVRNDQPDSWLQRISSGLVALPIACFVLFVFTYAVNVPWLDDIDAFLGFILAYTDATTLAGKVDSILIPNNEHRIVAAKLITLAMYYLTGEVNFRWLILIALMFILGILALFVRVFNSIRLPLLAFIPVSFFLLQPQYHLTSLWSIPGLQHPVVVFLTLTAMYLLTRTGRGQFAGALGLQVLATLSMSNGLMGWVAGAVILLLSRNWSRLGGWLAGGAVTIWVYFHNFQSGGRTSESLAYSLSHPLQAIAAFFSFTGSILDWLPMLKTNSRYALPTLAGLVFTVVVLMLVYRMNRSVWVNRRSEVGTPLERRRLFFNGCYIFLFGNAAIIALLRLRYGFDVMVVSNYTIYSAVLAAVVYLNVLSEYPDRQHQQRYFRIGLLVSLSIWLFGYGFYWPKVAHRKQMLLTSAVNQKHNGIGLGPTWGTPFADMAHSVMDESVSRGIYHYPVGEITPIESFLAPQSGRAETDSCLTMQVSGGGYSYQVRTEANAFPATAPQATVLIQSTRNTVLFASEVPFRFANFWFNQSVTSIEAEVITIALAPGQYKVGVLVPMEPKNPVKFSCRTLTIP